MAETKQTLKIYTVKNERTMAAMPNEYNIVLKNATREEFADIGDAENWIEQQDDSLADYVILKVYKKQ